MKYREIVDGIFLDRPNRFIAHVDVNGAVETVHVKNTGRCKELLLPGAAVRILWLFCLADACFAQAVPPPNPDVFL